MTPRSHLSIGEVLSLLQGDFSDITISKIRFLESQGLIDPERTPSGYRKFTEADVARLRWILQQQRDHFLPLKVIKDRLEEGVDGITGDADTGPAPEEETEAEGSPVSDPVEVAPAPAAAVGDTATAPPVAAPPPPRSILTRGSAPSMSLDELCRDTGLTPRNIAELERYGLLSPDTSAGAAAFGGDAVTVARAAAALRAQGVEARHLRMYKVAAEREAGYYEQLLMPVLKRRGAKSRREAAATLDELLTLGDEVRHALLRQAFGDVFDER